MRARLDRRGQGQTEYGLIIVLTGLVALLATLALGDEVKKFYTWIMERVAEVVAKL